MMKRKETAIERKIRQCAIALFERRLLTKTADPEPVKEVLRKYFGRKV